MSTMNRAMRRQAERNQLREWRKTGRVDQVMALQKNGITQQDLDKAYSNGYDEGYKYASSGWFRKMYAAIARELLDAGNSPEEAVSFVKSVDKRFALMFDADDEIEALYQQIGVRLNVDSDALGEVGE